MIQEYSWRVFLDHIMEFKRWHYDSSVPQMLRYTGASARGITENGIITDSSIEESAVKK